jgi:hypothetical protein
MMARKNSMPALARTARVEHTHIVTLDLFAKLENIAHRLLQYEFYDVDITLYPLQGV